MLLLSFSLDISRKDQMMNNIQKQIVKKIPTILTVMGAIGTVSAVAMSTDSAMRAKKKLEEAKDDISKLEKALIYAEAYAPTVLMTGASLVCIFGSNQINSQRIASLAGAYILKETALDEYKEKTEEIFGKKKAQQVKDEIVQDHISATPPTDQNTVIPAYYGGPETLSLWWDEVAKRYFYCNAEKIRKAELKANKELQASGFVSVNDIYEMLQLPPIKTGDDSGWEYDLNDPMNSRNREVSIDISGGLTDIDTPCGVMDMDPWPNSSWLGR